MMTQYIQKENENPVRYYNTNCPLINHSYSIQKHNVLEVSLCTLKIAVTHSLNRSHLFNKTKSSRLSSDRIKTAAAKNSSEKNRE